MLVPALATALVYGVGGYLVIQGDLTIGTLLALATLLLRLLGPLQGLSNVRIDVMTALVSFERVFEVLDLPTTVPEKPDAVALPRGAATVEFDARGSATRAPTRSRWPASRSVARKETKDTGEVLHEVSFTRGARRDGRPGRPVRGGQDHGDPPRRPAVRRDGAAPSGSAASTYAT